MMTTYTTNHYSRLAYFCLVLFLTELICPNVALALTAGPSQPEVQSFEPVGTTEMVNLFSGDFTYNIPLFEVPGPEGGYPVNLFYNSVTSMDQEATWTGLGWNINIGSLGRMMRGVPDDFSGEEQIERRLYMRPQERVGVGGNLRFELAGLDGRPFTLSGRLMWDSYKGVGFDLGARLELDAAKTNSGYQATINMGLNLSTLDGPSANLGFSMSKTANGGKESGVTNTYNAGLNFSGRDGLTGMTLGYTKSKSKYIKNRIKENVSVITGRNSYGTSISFGSTSYTPSVSIPWTGGGVAGSFNFAPGGSLTYVPFGINGSFSTQKVVGAGRWRKANAYGYNYLEKANAITNFPNFIADFNRANTRTLQYNTRFLHTPMTTYDVYNVMGQGVGGMYRAHRNEFGALSDPYIYSVTDSRSLGVEAGPAVKIGVDMNLTLSYQQSGRWLNDHVFKYGNDAEARQYDHNYEPFYYRVAGDLAAETTDAYDYMGKEEPLRLQRDGFGYQTRFENSNGNTILALSSSDEAANNRAERKPRSMSVQPIRNDQLLDKDGTVLLNEYAIKYYNTTNSYKNTIPSEPVARPSNKQNAGFTVLGNNGVRWIYGLPIMNHQHREVTSAIGDINSCAKTVDLSTDGGLATGDENTTVRHKYALSNDYLDEKKIPAYAHSYLLTSVVGTDYADVDNIAGPSDGDIGYWMKANYVKTTNDYQWRAPYFGANYIEGQRSLQDDNMQSFMWGKRENYLPATLETKTHIAHFYVSQRRDGRGAAYYIQNRQNATYGEHSYKLDSIQLFSKQALKSNVNAQPLKTVHFEYNYELCPNIENNAFANGGKLTLKKVWFTYEGSSRGALSPYQFDYGDQPNQYPYSYLSIDRWGAYRPASSDPCKDVYIPYVQQGGQSVKATLDAQIAAWHLKKITTPSGATINLELERDDYAYVQDKVATQMVPIKSLDRCLNPNGPPTNGGAKVYFDVDPSVDTQEELEQYIADLPILENPYSTHPLVGLSLSAIHKKRKQIYLKARVNVTSNFLNTPSYEDVPIYAFIKSDPTTGREIHFVNNDPTTGRAFVILQNETIKSVEADPIYVYSWLYLRENLPSRIYGFDMGGRTGEEAILSLFAAGASLDAILKGYYRFAKSNFFGTVVDYDYSFIKLNTPTKRKYGGDIRVKKVTLEDQWDTNQTSTIGVTYDYTTTDKKGQIISSGVVENEPSIGYDACALQYASIHYDWNILGQNNQIHTDVFPLNRGYYPGAKVGYSKVTVRSIASNIAKEIAAGNTTASNHDLADGFSKTGQTINEFYTCKDFPIITSSTSLSKGATAPWLSQVLSALISLSPISINHQNYTATQGYSIELNDMHGKPKRIATYAQNSDGNMAEEPLTYVEYNYHASERVKTGYNTNNTTKVYGLDNKVAVLLDDQPGTGVLTSMRLMGVEQEFFMDNGENISEASSGGFQFNTDVVWLFPPIPLALPIPNVSVEKYTTRTAVTNKIIKRHGILRSTVAYDGQSRIETNNLVYNAQTGQPILTSVDNQLGGKIYNYSVPADLAHATMGAAADNWGRQLKGTLQNANCPNWTAYEWIPDPNVPTLEQLHRGDEYIVTNTATQKRARAIYSGKKHNGQGLLTHQFILIGGLGVNLNTTPVAVDMVNVRSGKRNLFNATIAQYSTVGLEDDRVSQAGSPLWAGNRSTQSCTTQVVHFTEDNINDQNVVVLQPQNGPIVNYQTMDKVLSASANSYRDQWAIENRGACSNYSNGMYQNGQKGVWRMESAYAYVDQRKRVNLTTGDVDIKQSGVVDQVPLFNWKHPFFEYCQNKWIRTEDITKYNVDGNPVEARDVIGNHQAELYGYRDNLVVAKGANARYYELGYEGFEEPNRSGSLQGIVDAAYAANNSVPILYNSGNFSFFPHPTACGASVLERIESYRLSYPMPAPIGTDQVTYVLVRQPYQAAVAAAHSPGSISALSTMQLQLKNAVGEEVDLRVNSSQIQAFPVELGGQRLQIPGLGVVLDETTKQDFTVYKVTFGNQSNNKCFPSVGSEPWWVGQVTLVYKGVQTPAKDDANKRCVVVTNDKAHTGRYSLKLNTQAEPTGLVCGTHQFPTNSLHLQPGEEYILSLWMHVDGPATYDYNTIAYPLEVYIGDRTASNPLRAAGPMIEGWQKIEGKFTFKGDQTDFPLTLHRALNGNPTDAVYIDDIRLFPADGNSQTYVYDPVDYKLRATLDDNNYATFYIYNPEGDLVAVKRETERGIKTIQESRNFIKPTAQ